MLSKVFLFNTKVMDSNIKDNLLMLENWDENTGYLDLDDSCEECFF